MGYVRVIAQYVIFAPTLGRKFHDEFHRKSRALDYRLTHKDPRGYYDAIFPFHEHYLL
jgi:hypothetical protein